MELITWSDVADKIGADDCGKWDRKAPAAEISIDDGGKLVTRNGEPPAAFTLSDLATNQLCERLSIPVAYYRRLPAAMKATVANFDLRRIRDRMFLLRGKATHVRALLSGEYVTYDNRQIGETVERLLTSDSNPHQVVRPRRNALLSEGRLRGTDGRNLRPQGWHHD